VPLLVGLVVDRIVAAAQGHATPPPWLLGGPGCGYLQCHHHQQRCVGGDANRSPQQQHMPAAGGSCLAPEHVLALNSC
jgi:hypothetical protein